MPRVVDHDERRAQIAAAVWTLAARAGLEAVSLRTVAAEARVSMGRVQYYFASKDALLLHGLEHAHRWMEQRIRVRLAGTDGDDRAVLVAILDELLGGHPQTRDVIRVHNAFAARARTADDLAAVLVDGDAEIQALAVAVVRQAVADGTVADDVDPDLDGHALWTLARGLGGDVALYGLPIDRARAVLRHALARVAPPPPGQGR